MANTTVAARDVHATSPRDTLTGVAARSVPVTKSQPHPLPTPPNSISPALPPHGLRAQLEKARLDPIDSDLDLQDDGGQFDADTSAGAAAAGGVRSVPAGPDTSVGSPPYESTGVITPSLLGKHHLPDILLNHGPLAIRHIMGYLTTSVPGFAGIPPAKARRLVVGTLEGRGGGLDGDVVFEKVGWGRWDARRRGQAPRRGSSPSPPSPGAQLAGIPIAASRVGWGSAASFERGDHRTRMLHVSTGSSVGESAAFSHDDRDITMLENEADKMSMDGSASASCSEAPDDDVAMNDDPEDVTDDEDWAAVGAVALRAASYSNPMLLPSDAAGGRGSTPLSFGHAASGGVGGGGLRSVSYNAGMARSPQPPRGFDYSALDSAAASAAQEREAVEALLRLGSV